MNQLLEEALYQIYPGFIASDTEFKRTCETGDGWFPLLASLFAELGALSQQTGSRFIARQIKEKFGGLRLYFSCENGNDVDTARIAKLLIDVTEQLSESICDVCGEVAQRKTIDNWMRTACSMHTDQNPYANMDSNLLTKLLNAPRPKIDLSLLPISASIDQVANSDKHELTITRYRSMNEYASARMSDIEIFEKIDTFDSYAEAREAAKELGYRCLEPWPCVSPGNNSK